VQVKKLEKFLLFCNQYLEFTIRMARVYLCLGSNKGWRRSYINRAIKMLSKLKTTKILRRTPVIETEPEDKLNQPKFLNCVLEVDTALLPHELLERIQDIESRLKRERKIRWGPRTIDIDVLLYNRVKIKTKRLTIPHPRLAKRRFFLDLLNRLIPDFVPPGFQNSISTLRKKFIRG
jgi:2-amino-4-hydroxy-6-hydroxymethyldihydropteridine diphosphokinase